MPKAGEFEGIKVGFIEDVIGNVLSCLPDLLMMGCIMTNVVGLGF